MSEIKKGFGCIVGRFQTPYLHDGHKSTIKAVLEKHDNIIIAIGVHAGQNSTKNPLDYRTRQLMLQAEYPEAIIIPLPDQKSDKRWSDILDQRIKEVVPPMTSVVLYGGRDSFIPFYKGRLKTDELASPDVLISATVLRDQVIEKAINSMEFRVGVMYAQSRRFPSPYATVDVAVIRDGKVLVVKKPGEDSWRFCGGFGDNEGEKGWESDALREAREELGDNLELTPESLTYITSIQVDDWRYKSKEKIKTTFYVVNSPWGDVDPRDDIEFAKWVPFEDFYGVEFEKEHLPLKVAFLEYLDKKS